MAQRYLAIALALGLAGLGTGATARAQSSHPLFAGLTNAAHLNGLNDVLLADNSTTTDDEEDIDDDADVSVDNNVEQTVVIDQPVFNDNVVASIDGPTANDDDVDDDNDDQGEDSVNPNEAHAGATQFVRSLNLAPVRFAPAHAVTEFQSNDDQNENEHQGDNNDDD